MTRPVRTVRKVLSTPTIQIVHLQAGLELVELEDVDHEQQQHDEVDEEDAAHDLGRKGCLVQRW